MKRYIKSSSERPYLYIFKHGIGPGTLPKDVQVVRTKDLPRGYTAVWTDRFLTTSEMDEFDIPYETEINRYLDRIGYCQKNGDVVPCDEVDTWEGYPLNACDRVVASDICYRDRDNDDSVVALDAGMSDEDIEKMLAEHPSYYRSTLDRFEACNDITASTNGSQGDFTVIQEIYNDFNDFDHDVAPVYTQEYNVNLDEVLTKYPEVEKHALRDWSDETFKAGDMITDTYFAKYVEFIARGESDQMYADYKAYIKQHPEFKDPCREIEVRINNPQCLPSAEEIRRRHSEEMGRYLGKKLGLGRW